MTINGSSERDYESMWRALYVLIDARGEELLEQIQNENDSLKFRILSARYLQALEIQRLMERL